jgi:methyl-accepting chemotaxis protein
LLLLFRFALGHKSNNPKDLALLEDLQTRINKGLTYISQTTQHKHQRHKQIAQQVECLETTFLAPPETSLSIEMAVKSSNQAADKLGTSIDSGIQLLSAINTNMEEIDENNSRTTQVIRTIEDVADRTNIIAINASVEAARAGEAGRGFAVVAQQIRELAKQSKIAVDETNDSIHQSQESTKKGRELASSTMELFAEIQSSCEEISQLIKNLEEHSTSEEKQQPVPFKDLKELLAKEAAENEKTTKVQKILQSRLQSLDELLKKIA